MTVLILVGVVLVVGGVAVTTVICVRRQEAKKKEEATSGGQQTAPTKLQGRQQQCCSVSSLVENMMVDAGGQFCCSFCLCLCLCLSGQSVCLSLSCVEGVGREDGRRGMEADGAWLWRGVCAWWRGGGRDGSVCVCVCVCVCVEWGVVLETAVYV